MFSVVLRVQIILIFHFSIFLSINKINNTKLIEKDISRHTHLTLRYNKPDIYLTYLHWRKIVKSLACKYS